MERPGGAVRGGPEELEEVQERGGEAKVEVREELDALITELTAAYGLAGRPRRSPDPSRVPAKQSAAAFATP